MFFVDGWKKTNFEITGKNAFDRSVNNILENKDVCRY